MRKLFAPAAFCIVLVAGYWISVESWGGAVFVYLGEQRAPAAIRSMRDYSVVHRKAFFASVHKQMIEGAALIKRSGHIGLVLGHPLIKGDERNEFACTQEGRLGLFDRVEVTFLGLGISESGHQPTMVIQSDCQASGDLGKLDVIWVPMKDILAAEAKDQEMRIPGVHPLELRLENIPGEWPSAWVLSSVRFFRGDDPTEALVIDAEKMRETNGKLMTFDWANEEKP